MTPPPTSRGENLRAAHTYTYTSPWRCCSTVCKTTVDHPALCCHQSAGTWARPVPRDNPIDVNQQRCARDAALLHTVSITRYSRHGAVFCPTTPKTQPLQREREREREQGPAGNDQPLHHNERHPQHREHDGSETCTTTLLCAHEAYVRHKSSKPLLSCWVRVFSAHR